jgi:hypothetical protein
MALPSKKVKYDINIDPPKPGNEYLEYGLDRIEELMLKTDEKSTFLPRTILFEDIDTAIYNYVNDGNMALVIEGNRVPVIYLNNERWGEFSKTWTHTDDDNNIISPLITVRRTGKEKGTRLGTKYRIAQNAAFKYLDVPILDDGQVILLRFKIPEPTNVDLTYDVRFFTRYMQDANLYDETIVKNFASRQGYIFPKNHPMPVTLEAMNEESTVQNVEGDRYYVTSYNIKVLGYIQDEKEFEITKTNRLPRVGIDI